VEVFDPASTRVLELELELELSAEILRETLADWIVNICRNPSSSYTKAASIFVTAETAVKAFIPVVTVYYLRVAA
jgi:hypothetical protein